MYKMRSVGVNISPLQLGEDTYSFFTMLLHIWLYYFYN